jgi:hypothetical protein
MLLFAAVVAWGLWDDLRWQRLLRPQVVEMLALAVTFLFIYLVLPSRYSQAAYVDVRALMLISLFVVLARVLLADASPERARPIVLPLAALVATLNLAYLIVHLSPDNAWMNGYRAMIARIPRGAAVLPIYTGGHEGGVSPRLHTHSYIVMDRAALTGYLFGGDAGHPMKYFRYTSRPYSPNLRWYNIDQPIPVNWRAIACSYDFLLVDKPYDSSRIPIRSATVAENGSAALLQVARTANGCLRD